MRTISLILLGCIISLSLCGVSIEAFEGPPFSVKPPSGMYQLDGLNFDNVTSGNRIVAYGDFNNDKYTDIVTISDNRQTATIFIYSHEGFSFWPFAHITISGNIDTIIPADYNYDGNLDLLLLSLNEDIMQMEVYYFFRKPDAPFFGVQQNKADKTDTLNTKVQPFLFDAIGDRRMSLMYYDGEGRKVQSLDSGTDKQDFVANFASPEGSGCLNPSLVVNNEFTTPHSNSFVDFNGDCAADLFITSVSPSGDTIFETWLRNTDGRFCLVDVATITSKISQVTIGDMDNNGRVDLVFASTPSSGSRTSNLHIIYNQFGTNYKTPCVAPTTEMKSPFAGGAYTATATIGGITQVIPISLPSTPNVKLLGAGSTSSIQRVRLGDINIDGFPDVLLVVTPSSSNTAKAGNILLGINEGGLIKFDNSTLTAPDDHSYFTVLLENKLISPLSKPLSEYQVLSASFFDFDEIGKPGIWAVTVDSSGKTHLVGLFNFVNSENFILKTLGLNGFPPTDDIVQSLGGIYYGPSFECVLTDINGNPRLAKSVQLAQSAYTPLDLPYMFLGLGRTNNYVENFVMGIPKSTSGNDLQIKEWTPIIPNSQLIVNPLIENEWTLDVFVNPTSETLFIVLITLAILLILGIIIIYLHRKEKEEDEKNRDRILIG